ncbi:putative baseplate assembly protein [Cyanobacteria bacterium FACHB-DQ100]|nr:putative baseplate assembly protein [Cyanobacteria bacterium FACHB-DQ100]
MNGIPDPPKINNRPGLSALNYRIGTYLTFRERLLAHLPELLPRLKTRDPEDSAIALLDAWAVVSDVLTFYQERLANEGFLGTATERQSMIELARLVGYELKPGVAASTQIAFTIEDNPEAPDTVLIPQGTQLMSVPDEGGAPQTFETSENLLAHPHWNALKPRLTKPQVITRNTSQLYLAGINTSLAAGDWILLTGIEDQQPKRFLLTLTTVQENLEADNTFVTWEPPLELDDKTILRNPKFFAFRQRAGLFGNSAPRWQNVSDDIKRTVGNAKLKGGVFAASMTAESPVWEANSKGLPNQDIFCLASKSTNQTKLLFAGTAGGGIFRSSIPASEADSMQWTAVNTGLANLNVQALFVHDERDLFAGTPGGGVYRSKDNGDTWSPIHIGNVRVEKGAGDQIKAVNTGLPNVVVRSLLAYAAGETYYIFAGTDDSIYRTTNQGQDWSSEKISTDIQDPKTYQHLQGLPNRVVYDLLSISETSGITTGKVETASGDKTITVKDATNTPVTGRSIAVDGQTWKITEINTIKINLEQSFDASVISGASFTSSTDAAGTLSEISGTAITVELPKGTLKTGDTLTVGTQTQKISKIESYVLTLDRNFPKDLEKKSFESTLSKIFAATDQGIHVSIDHGESWEEPLSNKITYSLTTYQVGTDAYLLAGTNEGVWYYSINSSPPTLEKQLKNVEGTTVFSIYADDTVQKVFAVTEQGMFQATLLPPADQNWQWKKINEGLTTTDLTSIVISPDTQKVFTSARFSGFVEERQDPSEPAEWKNFHVRQNQVDLDSLYPKVLKDSWMVLINQKDGNQADADKTPTHAVVQVADVSTVQRQDFTLDTKVTRILPEQDISNFRDFGLRTSVALVQSELLTIAEESLTVSVQKEKIFQDPIWDNKIFLNQYTHGLAPGKMLVVSGKHIRARANTGGIFRSRNWDFSTANPVDKAIQSLVIYQPDSAIFASTKDQILYFENQGKSWKELIKNPENKEIQCLAAYTRKGGGEVAANDGLNIRISGSISDSNKPQVGDTIVIEKQSRIITNIKDEIPQQIYLTIDRPLSQNSWRSRSYDLNTLFAGTEDGVFRLSVNADKKQAWQRIASINSVRSLAVNSVDGQLYIGTDQGVFKQTTSTQPQFISESKLELKSVTALVVYTKSDTTYLVAVTASSEVFRSNNDGGSWDLINNQDLNQVSSLAVNSRKNYLFAGTTHKGVFRSNDHGNSWEPLNFGLVSPEIYSLAIDTEKRFLLASTNAGIFRSSDDGKNWTDVHWEHANQGLAYHTVQALASGRIDNQLYLFAGTRSGVFRSKTEAESWEPVNQGLRNLEVQTLHVESISGSDSKVFAGTKEGLFYSSDRGKSWEPINLGVVRPNVQTLMKYEHQDQKTLFAGTTSNGIYKSIDIGQTWIPVGLTKQNVRTLASRNGTIAAGSYGNGIFLSNDQGSSWKELTDTRTGAVTISSTGAIVIGEKSTNFLAELRPGDTLEAEGQTRTVISIDPNNPAILVVDSPFKPALKLGTQFTLHTGLSNLYITALVLVPSGSSFVLFAGTAGSGIFRSTNQGQRWEAINTGLNPNDLEIRCLRCDPETQHLFVGTAMSGVFRSTDRGASWKPLGTKLPNADFQTELTNIDVRAILIEQRNLYVGGIGILSSPDSLTSVELQVDDLLQVVKAPTVLSETDSNFQTAKQWIVSDRNGFQGKLTIIDARDIQLEPAIEDDPIVSETCVLQVPPDDEDRPILTLAQPLQYSYDPATVSVHANVVEATHGETVREILGSGNGAIPNQRFALNKPPLTYTAAPTPSGGQSTLKVFVNDVEWTEAASLYPLSRQDQRYIVQIQEDGTTLLTFGDGQRGARLPSGRENISVMYRSGIGLSGQTGAGRISQKKTGPSSILGVTNPLPATGAAPRESLDSARTSVPAITRTLDRIVSLQDFEDFAQTFAGIGKAQAVSLWNGEAEIVHLTVAAVAGETVATDSDLYRSLVSAIDAVRDPIQRVQVNSFQPLFFKLDARFLVQAGYQADKVEAAIRQQLLAQFAFERRAFAQPVTQSEVIAAIQSVPGVLAVDLDALHRRDASRTLQSRLSANPAAWDAQKNQIQPAQLLLLRLPNITLTPVATL